VPAALMPAFSDSDGEMSGVAGGNPDLEPEEATTSTLGVVWTSGFSQALVSNLQVSLDWYRIEVTDKIWPYMFADRYVQYCYDARYNPDFSLSNQWCTMFARDPVTGEIEDIRSIHWNAFDWETSGLDMQVDWRFDLGPGQVGVSWFVSWLDNWTENVVDSSAPSTEYSGTVGGGVGFSYPEWKSNLHLSYAWRDLTLGAGWRYIDAMTDVFAPEYQIPSVDYFSLDASYEFSSGPLEGLSFVLGVENLTDEDPPILPTPVNANTDPSQYDVFGRSYFVSLRYAF
jgi:outer membrane receptor protein involved in Fe transport